MEIHLDGGSISGSYTALDHVEIAFDKEVTFVNLYHPFAHNKAVHLGDNVWRLFFMDSFQGYRKKAEIAVR